MRIQSTRVWINEHFVPAEIEISSKIIWEILPYGTSENVIDFKDARILPGFIDIHCHGGYGYDANTAKLSGLKLWAQRLPEEGVTSFLPTVMSDRYDQMLKACRNIADGMKRIEDAAEILGIHLEGPFLSREYAGAQPKEAIIKPEIYLMRDFLKAAEQNIRIVTLAPEEDDHFALIRFLSRSGIIPSIGHSAASSLLVSQAVANGARSVTHTFNAQSGVHHRNNGVAGAALSLSDLYAEIIGDGHHVDPDVLRLFFMCKGKDRGILVSDSLSAKGSGIGENFLFAGQPCRIAENGRAEHAQTHHLVGSVMKMNDGIRYLIETAGVDEVSAINSVTTNPASLLKLDQRIGCIRPGYDADITILGNDYQVIQTICKGSFRLH